MTNPIRVLAAASLAFLTACGDTTAPVLDTQRDAARAADVFTRMADSVARNGGDADVGSAYSALADLVRRGGRVSPVTIAIDGVPTAFVATAIVSEMNRGPCGPTQACIAIAGTTTRSFIAWDRSNPKRVVQLVSRHDGEEIAAVLYPTLLAIYAPMASLIYLDGAGGTYFGTSGTQSAKVTTSATPCAVVSGRDSVGTRLLPSRCTQAEVSIAFNGTAQPSRFLVANNTATGTHTLAMPAQSVAGSHMLITLPACDVRCAGGGVDSGYGGEPRPPVVVRPSNELPATLTAAIDTVVTLTLTMRNPSSQPATVQFASGQKFDFVVIDSSSGRAVWRWSADKGFTQALEERTIAANGTLVFSASWKPASRGLYLARGLLVSTSHRSEAYTTVMVR